MKRSRGRTPRKDDRPSSKVDSIEGTVVRITYRNEADFYTVARVESSDGSIVTVVGNLPSILVGEQGRFFGSWNAHPVYGRQLRVQGFESLTPTSPVGIERYLASGLVKGVGPATARKLVSCFGTKTLEVIESQPRRLLQVRGISQKRAMQIHRAVSEQKSVQGVMVALQSLGLSPTYASKIFRRYGHCAPAVLEQNPYRLAEEVQGVGFKTADRIAASMGLPPDSMERFEAALLHCLREMAAMGHVMVPEEALIRAAEELGLYDSSKLEIALDNLSARKAVVVEKTPAETAVYLGPLYRAETCLARRLIELADSSPRSRSADTPARLLQAEQRSGLELAAEQRAAVSTALSSQVSLITGGPGTGKTTIVKVLIELFESEGLEVALAAPTGRAAKRLSEVTGREAKTIHRLLEYVPNPAGGNASDPAAVSLGKPPGDDFGLPGAMFGRNRERPLDAEAVIVDEASMLDISLAYHLAQAIEDGARLVFVGDADQLPSVGPGNVLRDILASGRFPAIRLTRIFRQAAQSGIILSAHRVNRGQLPILTGEYGDFIFVEREDPEEVAEAVVGACLELGLRGYDPISDVQVVSPMKRGPAGVDELNRRLQLALNPSRTDKPELRRGPHLFRLGDRVMQVVNDYHKEVFNGDCGRVVGVDLDSGDLSVAYPEVRGERIVTYDLTDLDEISPAFAVTVHKSQGSEYPAVVIPVVTQHYVMLQRNLLYTAITRGKKAVVVIGTKKALSIAVRNNRISRRFGRLAQRLNPNS